MQAFDLSVKSRSAGAKAAQAVLNGTAIGVVYGHGVQSTPVEGSWATVNKLLNEAGTSHIINLTVDDQKPRQALLKDIDFDPVTNQMRHFDLYIVKADEKIRAEVPIELVGDAPASRVGLLVHQLIDEVEVSTLPASLPESFSVDISGLSEVGESVYVSDLTLPEGVEIDEDFLEQPIVKVDAPREEEPEPEVETEVSAEDVPSEHGGEQVEGEEQPEAEAEKAES